MQSKKMLVFLLIITVFQLNLQNIYCKVQERNINNLSWLNYRKNDQKFTLSNPLSKTYLQFQLNSGQVVPISISLTSEGYWKSIYENNQFKITNVGRNELGLIQIENIKKQSKTGIKLNVKNIESKSSDLKIFVSTTQLEKQNFKPIQSICNLEKLENLISCTFSPEDKVYILIQNQQSLSNLKELVRQMDNKQNNQIEVSNLVKQLNLKKNSEQFAKSMITNTLSSLCVQSSQYEGSEFYGLCSNSNLNLIDRHYSLVVIDILFKYNIDLSIKLIDNFLDLLQQKLFYTFSQQQWIPIPQHIQAFLTYLTKLSQHPHVKQTELKDKINKVINIQNGLLNNLLLSEVNHLSEEINYRQNKKIHPTIMKMLTQAWKTDVPKARISSIYAQSFTGDFYYHDKNEKLDSSVGKMMWLIKLINQHIKVIKKYGSSYHQSELQQLLSLAKIMQGFVLDDPNAQQGKFHSIIFTQKIRVYTKSVGYQCLLPFVYDISNIFPTNTLVNLTTPVGLSSLPLTSQNARQGYDFRGNINIYFNYKILFDLLGKSQYIQKYKVFNGGVKNVIEKVQEKIAQDWRNDQKVWSSWNMRGEGKRAQRFLSMINLGFLRELGEEVGKGQKEGK